MRLEPALHRDRLEKESQHVLDGGALRDAWSGGSGPTWPNNSSRDAARMPAGFFQRREETAAKLI